MAAAMMMSGSFAFAAKSKKAAGDANKAESQQAGDQQAGKPDFDQIKQNMLKRLNQRMQDLQKEIECVNAATDGKALRQCRRNHAPKGRHPGAMRNKGEGRPSEMGEPPQGAPEGSGEEGEHMAPPSDMEGNDSK